MKTYKVLVIGCGNMGASHARAYHQLPAFELVGLVSRGPESREKLSQELDGVPTYACAEQALHATTPDVVSINTYPDTHAELVRQSLLAGAHVFVEKPLATTVAEAEELVALARQQQRKLVVGYILRVHPTWQRFVQLAQGLGKPLVMRMNLNQQSTGRHWHTHQQLLRSASPLVDCGVHYVDVMCAMTGAAPHSISAIGVNLSAEVDPTMYTYGQLQVRFQDGSVGWYEAGWGPMMSETAVFIKDVIGPNGAVSIIDEVKNGSQDIEGHTHTGGLRIHHAALDANGQFVRPDEVLPTPTEPDHDALCLLEQQFLLDAITTDLDLTDHLEGAVTSLRMVLAADEAVRTGHTVFL
ncbi:Gfo/Idh/MocA family oxidoreductase [Hymenobacter aerilatus]|uniref:Gfo/Idh/MocA family oxidoreductase n=1 Tax=Hymenobacter aerilatus TaxID=2932251 RepID=A0A8T9T4S7_9BACT|nr:Gfo/Idh/MocA family oxidoreductase [Hymenobacter aerilatus]UOR06899.1 Gfo/Idh/MocA family oxidoreductase [Hymenobacter aerilatus]